MTPTMKRYKDPVVSPTGQADLKLVLGKSLTPELVQVDGHKHDDVTVVEDCEEKDKNNTINLRSLYQ